MPKIQIVPNSDVIYRHWPAPPTKAVFLLVHGLGAQSARWEFLANYFSAHGFPSYAIELKGFGETKNLRGHIDSFNIYYQDIKTLYKQIKEEHADKKVFLIGESMGGLISFVMTALNPDLFSGLILISPAFKSALKFSIFQYIRMFWALATDPQRAFKMPFDVAMLTRDLAYQKELKADKRELRIATSRMLWNTLLAQAQVQRLRKKFKKSTLFLLAGKDYLIKPKVAKKVFARLTVEDKSLIEYPGMFHALPIDLRRGGVFEDILIWLTRRL